MYKIGKTGDTVNSNFCFTTENINLALLLKEKGVEWTPSAGCYIWDQHNTIKRKSPFPNNIYYILDIEYFTGLFGSTEQLAEQVVWLPTYLEALYLCRKKGVSMQKLQKLGVNIVDGNPGKELLKLYQILADRYPENEHHHRNSSRFMDEISKFHFIHYY